MTSGPSSHPQALHGGSSAGSGQSRVQGEAPPRATYRIQFHKGFGFDDAVAIVPYLAQLGVSHLYASPIQTARPGSTHGYDIVDHGSINPELGGEAGFERLCEALKASGLGLILDIVPNHMGIGGADNAWWLSVIEWGRLSPHAAAFDIDWERSGAEGKLVLPFLGKRYGEALEQGELELAFDEAQGGFSIWHFEHRFPISPLSYPIILDRMLMVAEPDDPGFREVLAVSARLRSLAEDPAAAAEAGVVETCEALKQRFAAAVSASNGLQDALRRALSLINGMAGVAESFDTLHRVLEMQSYRLAFWRVAASDINYRRFFDINTLAGVRVEDPEIFRATHALILDLVRRGRIQGLRIDHIDGLADPAGYLATLQAQIGPGFYILAEKILGHDERLRPWPLSGTTGYDTLNLIDGVLVDRAAADSIGATFREVSRQTEDYDAQLRRAKREIIENSFASELEVIVSDLARIAFADRRSRDYTPNAMRRALIEIVERFPVYRSYVVDRADPQDRALIESTVAAAAQATALPDRTLHRFIAAVLMGDGEDEAMPAAMVEHRARFRRRFQQLTGPVTAKSVEDTLFYRYVPLLALNEVGGEPGDFGFSPEAFHAANAEHARDWPHAMIATATHDTKRGEDGRARLLALSEMPERWSDIARLWASSRGQSASHQGGPDATDRLMILQQVLASWPVALLDQDEAGELAAYRDRLQGWVEKALREAKRHSSWTHPREAYETAAKDMIACMLEPGSAFLQHFRPLAQELAQRGMVKSLARTVLKLTLPGLPDFYQGTEFWDLSLVDPDNRRPVDYAGAAAALVQERPIGELVAGWKDGHIKQRLTRLLLADRAAVPHLYAQAGYHPLTLDGAGAERFLAFQRALETESRIVLVTRLNAAAPSDPGQGAAGSASLALPAGDYRDLLSGRQWRREDDETPVAELLSQLPVAVLARV